MLPVYQAASSWSMRGRGGGGAVDCGGLRLRGDNYDGRLSGNYDGR